MKYSFSAFENGFIRAAAVSPALRVADCAYNVEQIIEAMQAFAAENVQLLCLPELSLTGYTCSDLFLQAPLLRGAETGLTAILQASKGLNLVTVVGVPVRYNGKLYNCAAVVCGGELLGLVPKTYLPNYSEFYEQRHFVSGMREAECIEYAGQETLIGTQLLFACKQRLYAAYSRLHRRIHINLLGAQVFRHAGHSLIAHHHVHILLRLKQFTEEQPLRRKFFLLRQQLHGCQRCFHLMRPQGVIFLCVPPGGLAALYCVTARRVHRAHKRLPVPIQQTAGCRHLFQCFGTLAQQHLQSIVHGTVPV